MTDLMMWAGKDNYTATEYIREAKEYGVSKRIAITSIPEGVVSGETRLFIKHPEAIIQIQHHTLADLAVALGITEPDVLEEIDFWFPPRGLQPDDEVPEIMLELLGLYWELDSHRRSALRNEYGLTFHPGVIGYAYLTDIEYVCHNNEDALPEHLAHLAGIVTPVHDELVEDDEDDDADPS